MSAIQTIDIKSTSRDAMIDITALVRQAVRKSGVDNGIICIYCPHTTAAVTIQENTDRAVKSDMLAHLRAVVPREAGFAHDEGNSDAHIKSSVIGATTTLIVEGGKLLLGHWQAIFFCEFDGPRDRRVHVKVVSG